MRRLERRGEPFCEDSFLLFEGGINTEYPAILVFYFIKCVSVPQSNEGFLSYSLPSSCPEKIRFVIDRF